MSLITRLRQYWCKHEDRASAYYGWRKMYSKCLKCGHLTPYTGPTEWDEWSKVHKRED